MSKVELPDPDDLDNLLAKLTEFANLKHGEFKKKKHEIVHTELSKNVILFSTPPNNHGCKGFDVEIEPIDEKTGVIRAGSGCSSCWQVGHDSSESPISVGSIVALPAGETWTTAQEEVGSSHNELVDDHDDPRPDCTRVKPEDLVVLVRAK